MPSPSQLSIAASSVNRLLKEETTYRTELANQERHLEQTQGKAETEEDEGNRDFNIKQERKAIEETKAIFGPLHERISAAVENLEGKLADADADAQEGEVNAAEATLAKAKSSIA